MRHNLPHKKPSDQQEPAKPSIKGKKPHGKRKIALQSWRVGDEKKYLVEDIQWHDHHQRQFPFVVRFNKTPGGHPPQRPGISDNLCRTTRDGRVRFVPIWKIVAGGVKDPEENPSQTSALLLSISAVVCVGGRGNEGYGREKQRYSK